jgi:UPF0755 protein
MDNEFFKVIPAPREEQPIVVPPTSSKKFKLDWRICLCALFLVFSIALIAYRLLIAAPEHFPVDTVIAVEKGETLSGSAAALSKTGIVKSRTAFKMLMVLFGGSKSLKEGDYYLENPQNAMIIAWRLSHGEFGLKSVRVTIPEGLTAKEIAGVFAKEPKFTYFSKAQFIKIAEPFEGYLFPDTYMFLPNITAEDALSTMLENYKKRIETISKEITSFGRPIESVMKMASILEEEGRMDETRRVIAGILWKRLDEKMPLQVDASIVYATGKSDGNKLVAEDFKLESPYNTYLHLGLPPTPISNPGLAAIKAAVEPIKTAYYFYLTDPSGGFYPAATYERHLINKQKYLGN